MSIEVSPVEFADFSGGITDNTSDGPGNKYEKAENLVITKNKKLRLCPGAQILSLSTGDAVYSIPTQERVNALIDFENTLFHTALTQVSYTGSSSNSNLLGPTSNNGFNVGAETDKTSWAVWNKHLILTNSGFPNIVKVYKDSSGTWRLVQAGMPALANAPTCTPTAGANTYIYAFLYYRTYTVGENTFEDFGPVTEVTVSSAAAPNSNQIAISNIPIVSNSSTGNYDTSAMKVKIYRTINGGTTFYYVGEVTNGTTTYNDTSADTTIDDNVTIYTTGDIIENDGPPKAKYVHVADNICWYGHVKEGSIVSPNKIRQSIQNDPDSCPETFYDELEDEITGLSSVQGTLIAFCKKSIYRVEGFFDELGRGQITHTRIHDSIGCISNNSIVQAQNQLFFAGTDGFYYTNGYDVVKISEDLSATYKTLILEDQQKLNIYGAFDAINDRIWWAVQQSPASDDNDSIFVLHLNFLGQSGGSFTTMGNSDSFAPSSLSFFRNQMIRGDSNGYLFEHSDDYTTYPKVNILVTPTSWDVETIMYDFRSNHFSGGTAARKWGSWMVVNLENESNIRLQITSDNDKGRLIQDLALMVYTDSIEWGEQLIAWGNSTTEWGQGEGMIQQKKRFVADGLRFGFKQIRMSNGYGIIMASDDYGLATVSNSASTATLVNAATYDWDTYAVDYYLTFSDDTYTTRFPVTQRTSADVLTFLDIEDSAPNTNVGWHLSGYKKGEVFHLHSYVIFFAPLSMSQRPMRSSDLGENV